MSKYKYERHYLNLNDDDDDERNLLSSKYVRYGIPVAIILFVFILSFRFFKGCNDNDLDTPKTIGLNSLEKIETNESDDIESKIERAIKLLVNKLGIEDNYTSKRELYESEDIAGLMIKKITIKVPSVYPLSLVNHELNALLTLIGGEVLNAKQSKWGDALEMDIGFNGLLTHKLKFIKSGDVKPEEAKVALVVNDFQGADPQLFKKFIELQLPITFAIIPDSPYKDELLELIKARPDKSIIIHMPMEPEDYSKQQELGEVAIYENLPESEIRKRLQAAHKQIPNAVGFSNYMGSRITASERHMRIILDELRIMKLFFLDSRTSTGSLCKEVGDRIGAEVLVHLDFIDAPPTDQNSIERALLRDALEVRAIHDPAIYLAHATEATYAALIEVDDILDRWGICFSKIEGVRTLPGEVEE